MCTDEDNNQYIIEMQHRSKTHYIKRTQFYISSAYYSQLDSGSDYGALVPVILLSINNHNLFDLDKGCISYHSILSEKTHKQYFRDLIYLLYLLSFLSSKNHQMILKLKRIFGYTFLDIAKIMRLKILHIL